MVGPYVLAPGLARNLPRPAKDRWLGHFDLSLSSALRELLGVLDVIKHAAVPFELFAADNLGPLQNASPKASHLLFAGHGNLGRGQQQLRLSNGRRCGAADLAMFAPGATIVLNACWSGLVFDDIGSDPADLALSLLAAGAHSVLGAIGLISDRHAARFLSHCVLVLITGAPVARAVHHTITELLSQDPLLPLNAWACYATTGRAVDFAVVPDPPP
ncbi:CHAT domain-containing protein [Polymorphospora rubra]|uniref:CHAT domain-containing protein n=1 Tax=Polymorphospora rubra TaxID=338584 RepID=UPI0033EAACCA